MTDLGELAARLGSPITFDRRGDVIFFDSFEDGLCRCLHSQSQGQTVINPFAQGARTGGFCAEITLPGGSGASGSIAYYRPLPVLGRVGMEYSWSAEQDDRSIYCWLLFLIGTRYVTGRLGYNHDTGYVFYQNSDGDDVNLAAQMVNRLQWVLWNTMKVVVDVDAEEYVRAIVNDVEYDMSGIALRAYTGAEQRRSLYLIETNAVEAVTRRFFVDDIIVTQNEP